MDTDEQFIVKIKKPLTSTKEKKRSKKHKKSVSWIAKDNINENKKIRSTPFPKRKKKTGSNLIPVSLFNESDNSIESMDESFEEVSSKTSLSDTPKKLSASKKQDRKKRSQSNFQINNANKFSEDLVVNKHKLSNAWIETDIASPIPDGSISTFDPNRTLARKILKKIKKRLNPIDLENNESNVEINDAESQQSVIAVDQIEVFTDMSPFRYQFNDQSSDSECSEPSMQVSKLLQNPKKFAKQCKINGPNIKNLMYEQQRSPKGKKRKRNCSDVEDKNSKVLLLNPIKNENNKNPLINNCKNIGKIDKNDCDSRISLTKTLDKEESCNEQSDCESEFSGEELDEGTKITPDQKPNDSIQFYFAKSHIIFVINHPLKLYFQGKVEMTVLSGGLRILGYNIVNNETFQIFSPKGSSRLCFETIDKEKNINLNVLLKRYEISEKIIKKVDKFTIIAMKNISNNLTKCLDKYIIRNIFPKICHCVNNRFLSIAETKLQSNIEFESNSQNCMRISEQWEPVVDLLNENNYCAMVCGGKNVGKSTFLRYIINELLNTKEKIIYIDLDPGQPEFTIPGCISVTVVDQPLLGPSYTHQKKSQRCIFIGEVDVANCFNCYVESVKELMRYCNEEIDRSTTWLVNYMGFTQSLGFDLVIPIIRTVNPNLLIQIQSNNPKLNFPIILTKEFVQKESSNKINVYNLNSNLDFEVKVMDSMNDGHQKTEFEPKILRDISVVSYFSQMLKEEENITNIAPYVIDLSSINLLHIELTNEEDILSIINGNLVALCSDSYLKCLGFGIVRGIDIISNKLYLITPENREILEMVNTLIMGVVNLPASCYKTAGKCDGAVPYVCLNVPQATTDIPKRSYRACQYLLKK